MPFYLISALSTKKMSLNAAQLNSSFISAALEFCDRLSFEQFSCAIDQDQNISVDQMIKSTLFTLTETTTTSKTKKGFVLSFFRSPNKTFSRERKIAADSHTEKDNRQQNSKHRNLFG